MRLILVAACAALAVSACNQQQPAPPAEPTPPAEPPAPPEPVINGVDLTAPLRAVGTEPFWAIEMTPSGLKYTSADDPTGFSVPNPGPTMTAGRAEWSGADANGKTLKVVMTSGPCSDGMSDRTYPLTAEVDVGAEKLRGCGATIEALERMRGKESGEVR